MSKDDDDSDKKSDSDDEEEEDEDSEESDGIEDLPSQNQMKRDLIQAIEEELREKEQLEKENEDF